MTLRVCMALLVLLSRLAGEAQARAAGAEKPSDFVRSNYAKFEYNVPMRDGVQLFTSVYAPKDHSRQYPILLLRTPYSVEPYGSNNYGALLNPAGPFAREGFIFVYQDVRGRYLSEGDFMDNPPHKTPLDGPKDTDPATDAYDTIDWLVKNIPNNNGRVGLWGVSYPGFFAAFGLINSHPALKAVSPQAPMADVGNGDDAYHNGAFFLAANFGFYTGFWPRGPMLEKTNLSRDFDFGTKDEYDFYLRMGPLSNAEDLVFKHKNVYWSDMLEHPNYDDYWTSRALGPDMFHLTAPVLLVGGWFDAEDLGGTLKLFHAIEDHGRAPGLTLVMGPWAHGQWSRGNGDKLGNLNFASRTGEYFRAQIEFPFFMQSLKGGKQTHFPKAWMFETGENQWLQCKTWPPKNAARRSLYLQSGGKLSFSPPSRKTEEFDEYVSDPAKPVPVTDEPGEGMPADYMTRDQRFASLRPDVLTYQTEPLQEAVTLAGPVTPVLRVSTSGTDSDFMVKLIDVYPDGTPDPDPNPKGVHFGGYQQMVRGEPFRGKFRNSLSRPEPFLPGQPVKIEFAMPDVLHKFKQGHRIMVQIQSTWFPLVDRNPQQFEDIPSAKASDFQKAVERVYRGGKNGTHIDVLVMK
jgi:uncharacterized protein